MVRSLVGVLLFIAFLYVSGCRASIDQIENRIPNYGAIANQTCKKRYYINNNDNSNPVEHFPVDARLYEHPWLVQFGYERNQNVSYVFQGLLIHPKYVISTVFAAQFEGLGQLKYARVGEHNTSTSIDCENQNKEKCAPPVQDILVDEVIVHPDYNMFAQTNDIALVKLRTAVLISGDSVASMCLNRNSSFEPPFLLIASWCGRRETGLSLVPKQYLMKQIDPNDCQNRMPDHYITLENGMFCVIFDEKHTKATDPVNEPNLRGGSGAPIYVVHEGETILLIGLLSYGPRYPAKLDQPYIITPVAPYYHWLSEVIEADLEKHMYQTAF